MAENTWIIQDGRSILVQFEAAPAATNWGWFGNRGGDSLEFAAAATPWSEHNWLRSSDYIMVAEVYVPPVGGSAFRRTLMGIGV